jgi:hypothetical protein
LHVTAVPPLVPFVPFAGVGMGVVGVAPARLAAEAVTLPAVNDTRVSDTDDESAKNAAMLELPATVASCATSAKSSTSTACEIPVTDSA